MLIIKKEQGDFGEKYTSQSSADTITAKLAIFTLVATHFQQHVPPCSYIMHQESQGSTRQILTHGCSTSKACFQFYVSHTTPT
jgi:hypothetical protein